jgi:LysR family transcriptional regulator, transcriptional activator for aaeXAB operon
MQQLYYELSVLTKAIHFKNLSAAAIHVGLSQPQLSRIIARIEDEFKVILLDRSAKRKSSWTPIAFEMAGIFDRSIRRLGTELQGLSQNNAVAEIHIGTLEGMAGFAIDTCKICFEDMGLKKISLDIYDLNELDSNFLAGNLDMIFTSKIPGRQKFRYLLEIGSQVLEKINSNKKFGVFSTFEYGRSQKKELEGFEHLFISNSLAVRKAWLDNVGGVGYIPSETRKGRLKEHEPVFLIGSELLSPILWEKLEAALSKD